MEVQEETLCVGRRT